MASIGTRVPCRLRMNIMCDGDRFPVCVAWTQLLCSILSTEEWATCVTIVSGTALSMTVGRTRRRRVLRNVLALLVSRALTSTKLAIGLTLQSRLTCLEIGA